MEKNRKEKVTASRDDWSSLASWVSKEEILGAPDSPLAKAITVSLVLVSPSTWAQEKTHTRTGSTHNDKSDTAKKRKKKDIR